MSTLTQTRDKPAGAVTRELSPASRNYKAWVAQAAEQPMVLETLDPGPLGDEDIEVAVEHCGLCHSDLSVVNNEWGISQFSRSTTRGHRSHHGRRSEYRGSEGRPARGRRLVSGSDMHCRQCLSGITFARRRKRRSSAIAAGSLRTSALLGVTIPLPEKRTSPTPGRCSAAASPSSARWRCTQTDDTSASAA